MPQEMMERHAIIEALRAGRTAKEIIDFFNYNKDLVYKINLKLVMTLRPSLEKGKPTRDVLVPSEAPSLSLKSSRGSNTTPPSPRPPWPSK